MLPLLEQSGVCQGHGTGSSRGPLPVLRGSSSARPLPLAGQHASAALLSAARSRPLPVGGARRGAGGLRATGSAAPSPALATPPGSLSSANGCLSRQFIEFGYDTGIEDKYAWGRELGKGGNGVVRVAVDRASGEEYACKILPKVLSGADVSDAKRRGHVEAIKREIEVLRRLSGSLAVVRLVDVFEDDDSVYLVQELCRGGELHHRIGARHYSERTVASFMRAVLRTLAQCHSHHILHRDIKPGNFMLLDDSERSPLKAIDFGLAVPFDPEGLPRSDLGFEGTPWYMAPEVLSSQVLPASDLWSAGVMAHQLLTGRLPFDDHRNPFAPSISAVWKSVLVDKVAYNTPWWAGVSDDAKDFVASLLQRDPAKRPTAKEALKHPWLRGDSAERSLGKQIDVSVVQRIQRFAQASHFKRGVLQLIAEELLSQPGARAALAASASSQDLAAAGDTAAAAAQQQQQLERPPRGVIPGPDSGPLREIYRKLQFDSGASAIDRAQAAEALSKMGFTLMPSELAQLVDMMDTSRSGRVRRSAVAASQIDWRHMQQSDVDAWITIARRAFSSLDKDKDGVISPDEIVASLRAKLPEDELRATLEQVMSEAGAGAGDCGLDFDSFLNMLKVGSVDSLDQYDSRYEFASPASLDRLQSLLDASHHGSDGSSHRGRRPGSRAGSSVGVDEEPAAPPLTPAADYRDKSWNQPPPNFRFDFGGWSDGTATAAAADTAARATAPADAAPRAWPGLTVGAPAAAAAAAAGTGLLQPAGARGPLAANGTVRAGAHFDKRMHGASLYRNMLVNHGPAALETVKE